MTAAMRSPYNQVMVSTFGRLTPNLAATSSGVSSAALALKVLMPREVAAPSFSIRSRWIRCSHTVARRRTSSSSTLRSHSDVEAQQRRTDVPLPSRRCADRHEQGGHVRHHGTSQRQPVWLSPTQESLPRVRHLMNMRFLAYGVFSDDGCATMV